MNYKPLFIFIFCIGCCFWGLNAQPAVESNNYPKKADRIVYAMGTVTSSTVDTGSDLYWNFSGFPVINSDSSVWEYQQVPSSIKSLYPSATLAAKVDESGNSYYQMYALNGNKLEDWGIYFSFPTIKFQCSDAQDILNYPIIYGTGFSDIYALKYATPGDSFTENGSVNIRVNGWGLIKLPNGKSYDTALMISANYLGVTSQSGKTRKTVYSWYHPMYKSWLAKMAIPYTWTGSTWVMYTPSFYYQKAPLSAPSSVDEMSASGISLSPNPAGTVLNLGEITSRVFYRIYDIRGICVLKGWSDGGTIHVSELGAGIYQVALEGAAHAGERILNGRFVKL